MHENWRCASGPSITQRTDCELPWYNFLSAVYAPHLPLHFCCTSESLHKHIAFHLSENVLVIVIYLCLWFVPLCTCCDEFLYQPQNCTVTILFSSSHLYASRNVGLHVHLHMLKCHSSPAMFFYWIENCLLQNFTSVDQESHIRLFCAIASRL